MGNEAVEMKFFAEINLKVKWKLLRLQRFSTWTLSMTKIFFLNVFSSLIFIPLSFSILTSLPLSIFQLVWPYLPLPRVKLFCILQTWRISELTIDAHLRFSVLFTPFDIFVFFFFLSHIRRKNVIEWHNPPRDRSWLFARYFHSFVLFVRVPETQIAGVKTRDFCHIFLSSVLYAIFQVFFFFLFRLTAFSNK